jgi:hypothetical protein
MRHADLAAKLVQKVDFAKLLKPDNHRPGLLQSDVPEFCESIGQGVIRDHKTEQETGDHHLPKVMPITLCTHRRNDEVA